MRFVPVKTVKQQARLAWHRARAEFGLNPLTFSLYWYLHGAGLKQALLIAQEIVAALESYPNHADNDDELRQLKARIYGSLMREASGPRMVTLKALLLRPCCDSNREPGRGRGGTAEKPRCQSCTSPRIACLTEYSPCSDSPTSSCRWTMPSRRSPTRSWRGWASAPMS